MNFKNLCLKMLKELIFTHNQMIRFIEKPFCMIDSLFESIFIFKKYINPMHNDWKELSPRPHHFSPYEEKTTLMIIKCWCKIFSTSLGWSTFVFSFVEARKQLNPKWKGVQTCYRSFHYMHANFSSWSKKTRPWPLD